MHGPPGRLGRGGHLHPGPDPLVRHRLRRRRGADPEPGRACLPGLLRSGTGSRAVGFGVRRAAADGPCGRRPRHGAVTGHGGRGGRPLPSAPTPRPVPREPTVLLVVAARRGDRLDRLCRPAAGLEPWSGVAAARPGRRRPSAGRRLVRRTRRHVDAGLSRAARRHRSRRRPPRHLRRRHHRAGSAATGTPGPGRRCPRSTGRPTSDRRRAPPGRLLRPPGRNSRPARADLGRLLPGLRPRGTHRPAASPTCPNSTARPAPDAAHAAPRR